MAKSRKNIESIEKVIAGLNDLRKVKEASDKNLVTLAKMIARLSGHKVAETASLEDLMKLLRDDQRLHRSRFPGLLASSH